MNYNNKLENLIYNDKNENENILLSRYIDNFDKNAFDNQNIFDFI